MKKTYKFVFPFKGQVKTQLIISKNRLVKPKNVRLFENAVRACLAETFPLEQRPIEGYLKFDMYHFTQYKRDNDGVIIPQKLSDIDNIYKTLADSFEPIYKKVVALDENGEMIFTSKGNVKYTKELITPGVIKNDKYIMKANLSWIPVETKEEEKIEVYITPITEKELFEPPNYKNTRIIDLS